MPRTTLLLLTLLSVLVRGVPFAASAHPLGTDGYYYAVQAASWPHGLHVPDSSWMLHGLGIVGLFVDPIVATKLTALFLATACVPAAWVLGQRLGPHGGWWLAGWAAVSPTLTHLAADFPKNLAMVTPWLLLCAALLGPRKRWGVVLGLGLWVALAHKLGAVLLVTGLVGYGLAVLSPRVFVGLGLIGLVLAGVAALPGTLSPGEGWRITGQIAPGSGWPPFCWFDALSGPERLEQLLAVVGIGIGLVRRAPILGPNLPLLLLAFAPVWATDGLDLGYRLTLIAPVLAAPLWAEALAGPSTGAARPLVLLGFAGTAAIPDAAPPYDRYEALVDAIPRPLPNLLIAHQGINFLYHHRTGAEAMAWAPEPALDPTRIGRLVWGIREAEWVSSGVERTRLDHGYSYVREDDWRRFRDRQAIDDDLRARIDDWRNPVRIRPAALVRGRAKVTQEGR